MSDLDKLLERVAIIDTLISIITDSTDCLHGADFRSSLNQERAILQQAIQDMTLDVAVTDCQQDANFTSAYHEDEAIPGSQAFQDTSVDANGPATPLGNKFTTGNCFKN